MHANRIFHALADLFLGHARLRASRADQAGDRLVARAHMFLAHQEADFKLWNLKIAHACCYAPSRRPAACVIRLAFSHPEKVFTMAMCSTWPSPGQPIRSMCTYCPSEVPVTAYTASQVQRAGQSDSLQSTRIQADV